MLSYVRRGVAANATAVVVHNLTPVVRSPFRVGLPHGGTWEIALNSDDEAYGGSGVHPAPVRDAEAFGWQGRDYSVELKLPPLATLVLVPKG